MEHDYAILFSIDLYGRKRFVHVHDLKETCHFFYKKKKSFESSQINQYFSFMKR